MKDVRTQLDAARGVATPGVDAPPVLSVRGLTVSFPAEEAGGKRVNAIQGVSFTLHADQTLAIVGESGSGKSITALSLIGLLPKPAAKVERGRVVLSTGPEPIDLLTCGEEKLRTLRGSQVAMVFQEPMTALNPVMSVGEQLLDVILAHRSLSRDAAKAEAVAMLRDVGIDDPAARLGAYPHQLSGGLRQRVTIAIALACSPKVLLADEPTTALDATVQTQILDLLSHLRRERGLGVLLITHALGVVSRVADTVCVMQAGRVVEYGPTASVLASPMHPYTRALLSCAPRLRHPAERLATVLDLTCDDQQMSVPLETGRVAAAWWPGVEGHFALARVGPRRWVGIRDDTRVPDAAVESDGPW